ncbi:MAG TPA: DUF2252 domain-containing protein [Caldimonas sp.]|nr:DUF2252 domain-containing protein [Caldimonas sp.]
MAEAIGRIIDFNAGRDPQRLELKYRAMRASTFAFMRGTCHLFYDRLPRGGVFKSAPAVWVCGDLHLENFGSYKGDNRLVYFDINDFDESALAPASWDLVRLLTSIRIAADTSHIDSSDAQSLCEACLQAYGDSLAEGKAYWVERETAQGLVRALFERVEGRQRAAFLDSRTVLKRGKRRLRIDGKKALPATDAERSAVRAFMEAFASAQKDPGFYTVLDVANRIAGTGSLGVDRYVILVQGKGSPDGNYLLDLKRALPSALSSHLKLGQPAWPSEAHRVASLQQLLQAVSIAFLHPVMVGEKPFVLRALQPAEDRVVLTGVQHSALQLHELVSTLGRIAAWAQLRSGGRGGSAIADELIEFARRRKWKEHLLDASIDCAAGVMKDAAAFNAAWDDGRFGR